MGSLIWALKLWSMRLAAGAAVIATMGAAVAMYSQTDAARDRLEKVVAQERAEQTAMWEGL